MEAAGAARTKNIISNMRGWAAHEHGNGYFGKLSMTSGCAANFAVLCCGNTEMELGRAGVIEWK